VSTASASAALAPRFARHPILLVLAALAGIGVWSVALGSGGVVEIDMGPGALDYVQGMSASWVFDGESFWRSLETRSRIFLPLSLRGPGTLTVTLRSKGPSPSEIRAELDDASLGTLTVAPGSDPLELRWAVPDGRRRASVRLRSESGPGSEIEISRVRWTVARMMPSRDVAIAFAVLVALSYLALAVAGTGPLVCLGGALGVALSMSVLSRLDAFAGLHLASRLAPAAGLGLAVLLLARYLAPRSSAPLRALFLLAVLVKSALLFHPRFYFVDLPIHETLLELVYHRGARDFWLRLPEYQKAHNLGVAPVGGEYLAFPYSVAFYYLAGIGNRLHHAPELWLKLTASVLAALALFPLGSLARTLSQRPRAPGVEVLAGVAYLLVPSITRSLLLLELSAVAGCFFDLLALGCLARLSLELFGPRRFALASAAMIAALVVYTAGFIHFGLFIAAALSLGLFGRGRSLDRANLARLAAAGILSAVLALLAYNPETVRALPAVVLTGIDGASTAAASMTERSESVVARVVGFLGLPLLGIGTFGVGAALRKLDSPSMRLLFQSWALSALVAVALRVFFPEIFHYAKELYWGGALLACGVGSLLASVPRGSRGGRLLLPLALAALALACALSFRAMAGQFYTHYLFL
jgi:hypothetical protein